MNYMNITDKLLKVAMNKDLELKNKPLKKQKAKLERV